jgi:cobalamin biosynthesis protein CobD/CbiB
MSCSTYETIEEVEPTHWIPILMKWIDDSTTRLEKWHTVFAKEWPALGGLIGFLMVIAFLFCVFGVPVILLSVVIAQKSIIALIAFLLLIPAGCFVNDYISKEKWNDD